MTASNILVQNNELPRPVEATVAWTWNYNWDQYLGDQRLAKDTARLFSDTKDEVHIIQGPDTNYRGQWLDFNLGLVKASELTLPFSQSDTRDTFFIIQQIANSWGRLSVSERTFRRVISSNSSFAYFMRTVHAFGSRSRDNNDTWNNFHWRISSPSTKDFELCYAVRFLERNNRGGSDAWSLRQVGVYQRICSSTNVASWIILQFSQLIKNALADKLKVVSADDAVRAQRHSLLHLAVLGASIRNWDEYIDYQATELFKMERKAQYADLDEYSPFDYQVAFADRQKVQIQRSKLITARAVIESSIILGQRMQSLYKNERLLSVEMSDAILLEFDDYIHEVTYYKGILLDLIERSKETASLLSNILDYRTSKSTLSIAQQGELEGKLAQKDSINIKALTVVATLYLPASLLAGIFSSNLVQAHPANYNDGPTRFVVARDFWKFIVVLVPMVIGTFTVVGIFQRFSKRSHEHDLEKARKEEEDLEKHGSLRDYIGYLRGLLKKKK